MASGQQPPLKRPAPSATTDTTSVLEVILPDTERTFTLRQFQAMEETARELADARMEGYMSKIIGPNPKFNPYLVYVEKRDIYRCMFLKEARENELRKLLHS